MRFNINWLRFSSDKPVSTKFTGVQDTITNTIDTYLNANPAPNEPDLSIIIKKDDVVVYQSNRGLANKQTNTSPTMNNISN